MNSGVYTAVTVPGQIGLGLMCAVALNRALVGRAAFRIMVYIPVITSWVVVSVLFRYLFATDGGLVTYLYRQAFNFLGFGYGSAIAFMLAAIIFVLSIGQYNLGRHHQKREP